jgi:hypothetical protein
MITFKQIKMLFIYCGILENMKSEKTAMKISEAILQIIPEIKNDKKN